MNNSVRCQRGLANIVNQIGFYPQAAGFGPAEFLGVPGPFFADGRAPVEVVRLCFRKRRRHEWSGTDQDNGCSVCLVKRAGKSPVCGIAGRVFLEPFQMQELVDSDDAVPVRHG